MSQLQNSKTKHQPRCVARAVQECRPADARARSAFGVWSFLALWILGFGISSAHAWNYETPFEFVSEADFDGDGRADVVIVDKVTGAFRIGYQSAPGDPVWADARATGIDGVTGISAGPLLNTSRDTLVATSPSANRINLVEAVTASSPALPVSVFIPSLGPNLAAAIDIGGGGNTAHADLYITSQENPGPRETLMRNTGAARSVLSDGALGNYRGSANPFQFKFATPARLALMNRNAPANDQFLLLDLAGGAAAASITFTVPMATTASPQFVGARFDGGNALAQVLFYRPGDAGLLKYQIQEPAPGSFAMGGSNSFSLGAPIQQVQIVARATTPRLLVLFGSAPTNATVATIYDFDGVNPPVPVQSFTNLNGFTAAGALGNGNVTLLAGDGSGRSTRFENKLASGNGYVAGTSGALPKVTPYSGAANVVLFAGEPFVDANAAPLKSLQARDWSSGAILAGAPLTVTVTGEKYLNPSNGLANGSAVALGTAPAGTTHALVNQYTNPISIFARRSAIGDETPGITISPPAGEYPSAIQVTLDLNVAGWAVRYRFGMAGAWQTYTAPITLYSNATIQCLGVNLLNAGRTPILTASYRFTEPVSTLDSDHDGVPDFVESDKGLDPRGGADSDGDGFTDLEELVRNTLANVATNHPPTNGPRLQTTAAFDRIVTPLGVDYPATENHSARHTEMRVYSLDGNQIASGLTTNITSPFASPSTAKMTNIIVPAGDKLVIETTPANFDLMTAHADTRLGRELIGLVPLPLVSNITVSFTYTGGVVNVAASNWIVAASNLFATLARPQLIGNLVVEDALVAALFERKIGELLVARGTNAATNITLFPFRGDDASRTAFSSDTIATVECYVSPAVPGFNLATLRAHLALVKTSALPQHVALRQAAREIYEISAEFHNSNAPAYPPPFGELRKLVAALPLGSNYGAQPTLASLLANARLGASNLLASAPPRPTTNATLEVVSLSPSNAPIFELVGTDTLVTLWQKDGKPCALPQGFDLLPGSRVSVFAHTDINPGGPGLPLEVITLSLASVPVASDGDANGDLLIDSWQGVFFGGGFGNAFADNDGDGYSNIQEMLAGSDPNTSASMPAVVVVNFMAPMLNLNLNGGGGQTMLNFQWPANYIGHFKFGVRASQMVNGAFLDLAVGDPVHLGGDNFALNFSLPAVQMEFYYLTIGLK